MKQIKPLLLSLMLMLTSGVAWSDPTFFNLFGINTETKLSEAKVLLRKNCFFYGELWNEMEAYVPVSDNKSRFLGLTLQLGRYLLDRNDDTSVCRNTTVMGLKPSYIAFSYEQKWLGKFITGLFMEIPLLPKGDLVAQLKSGLSLFKKPNAEELKAIVHGLISIRDTVENTSFYKVSSGTKANPTDTKCLGNYEELFKYLSSDVMFIPHCKLTYRHINDPKKHVSIYVNALSNDAKAEIMYYAYK